MKQAGDVWDRIRRRGRRIQGSAFAVYGLRLSPAPPPRIVVPTKVDKRATVRNRIKRQIREAARQSAAHDWGLIVIVKPGAAAIPASELRQSADQALNQFL